MSGSSVSFYPFGNMRQAKIISVVNAAAGFPKENMVDFNPDTYWKQSANAIHEIDIDLGATKTGDGFVLLIQNFLTSFLATTADMHTDDNDDGLYTATTSVQADLLPGVGTQQIRIKDIGSSPLKRFWRLKLNIAGGSTQAPQLSGLFITRKFTIAQAAQWPERDIDRFHNRVIESAGGREFVQSINFNPRQILTRKYRINLADMNTLKAVFNDCKGRVFPLILQEGSSDTDARLVRFASDSLNENQLDFELFEPTVQFVEIPFIPDGEVY